jgi:hypothetical membrane protein
MDSIADRKQLAGNVLFTVISGLSAFLIITGGALLSAWYYSGRTHESYSFFNHFISELGNRNYSGHAYFFNGGMMLAGIPIIAFMIGISSLLSSRLRHPFLLAGVLSGILCILLGYYSSDRFDIHIKVAMAQFNAMLFSSTFFSIAVLREGDRGYFGRWLGYSGALPILCILSFLWIEYRHQQDVWSGHVHQLLYHRPAFWPLPFMEWMVFFSLITWVALICGYLMYAAASRDGMESEYAMQHK